MWRNLGATTPTDRWRSWGSIRHGVEAAISITASAAGAHERAAIRKVRLLGGELLIMRRKYGKRRHATQASVRTSLQMERLEQRQCLAGDAFADGPLLVISEFVADNNRTLRTRIRSDSAAEFPTDPIAPDWIEITNLSDTTIDLEGIHLTDDEDDLTKWTFPPGILLESGQQLVVFASGHNIVDPLLDEQGALHTNFRLSVDGEFLAITSADGAIIDGDVYPPQETDLSFGIVMDHRQPIDGNIEYLIPRDDSLEGQWQQPHFQHADWVKATGPIGFERLSNPEPAETVGAEVIDRATSEVNSGSITVLSGSPFSIEGQVTEWSFYSSKTSTITPLIVRSIDDGFEIHGVGTSRVSDGSGAQTFPFELQAGSDRVSPGEYFFATKDGDNEIDNNGVSDWGRSGKLLATRFNGPHLGQLAAGHQLTSGVALRREYSVQATTIARLAGPFNANVETALADSTSLFIRYPFVLDDPDTFVSLQLQMRYDDGFVAYLNGKEVARRNAPVNPTFDGTALTERLLSDSNTVETINVSPFINELRRGDNVLAVHGFGDRLGDSDFLIDAQLFGHGIRSLDHGGFSASPTPGEPNGPLATSIASPPTFSVTRGFYDQPFELTMEAADPHTVIYYTNDGSLPEPDNPQAAVYVGPLTIDQTTALRARSFVADRIASPIESHTYLFVHDVSQHNGMSPVITEHPDWGPKITSALLAIPTVSVMTVDRVTVDEVGASMELIYPDGSTGFQIDAGVEAYGGTSLGFAKQSMRFSFKDDYGPSSLEFDVFDDADGVTEFQQLLLRSGAHDTMFWTGPPNGGTGSYIRNRWAFDRQLEMGHPAPRGRFVHVYQNGQYLGLFELLERPNADFMASNLGGDESDYDVLNAGSAIDGDLTAWNALIASLELGYDEVTKYLDPENYADYLLLQYYGGNDWDWRPSQNWMAGRKREPGAGFQFFAWDSDVVLRTGPERSIVDLGGPGNLWIDSGGVRQYDEFLEMMADRVPSFFGPGGMFSDERLRADVDELADSIRLAIIPETARWGGNQYTPDTWQAAIDWIKETYAPVDGPSRADTVLDQMRDALLIPAAETPRAFVDGRLVSPDQIQSGDVITLESSEGTIYYTLDGTDPRLAEAEVEQLPIVPYGGSAQYLIPTDDSLGNAWIDPDFDDRAWQTGQVSLGFDRNDRIAEFINTDIREQMDAVNSTIFVRVPFTIEEGQQLDGLRLDLQYDDGFVAYLNGVEIARRQAPEELTWDARAASSQFGAGVRKVNPIFLSKHLGLLRPGKNVLAFHAMNRSPTNSDFLIAPTLHGLIVTTSHAASSAIPYTDPFVVPAGATIRARSLSAEWSTPLDIQTAEPKPFGLRFAEVMYHPSSAKPAEIAAGFGDSDEFEFIEFVNTDDRHIDLMDVKLVPTTIDGETVGVEFDFATASQTQLAPGERIVVVENLRAFEHRYGTGIPVAGQWQGGLSNRTERLTLVADDQLIQTFDYHDAWHPLTDGHGASLEIIDAGHAELARWNRADGWKPSRALGGTPGTIETEPFVGDSNRDGQFDSRDIDLVFRLGEYQDNLLQNSTFDEGDWNGDGEFDSEDFVFAFVRGNYRVT